MVWHGPYEGVEGGLRRRLSHGRNSGLVGVKGEVTLLSHASGKVVHDGLGLDMEVSEHFVRAPAANESNDVGINLCT